MSKHYHMIFDPKLGHDNYAMCRIIYVYAECTYMIDTLWAHCLSPQQHPHDQPVTNCNYWLVIGSFNHWNIITFPHNATTSEYFEEIHQVFLYGIGDNMASLVQYGKYSVINTTDTTTIRYYVIGFVLEAYNLQNDTTCDGKISSACELVAKAHSLSCIQESTK